MTSRVFPQRRPKLRSRRKNFNLWNDRKVGPDIEGLSSYQFADIVLHSSVDMPCARCRSQEATDQLKSIEKPARLVTLLPFASVFELLSETSSNQDNI